MGIKQLALELGLSIATVSRALNDHPESSEETRKRVKEAARARGYSANQSGRSLRKGKHNTIGLMLPPKSSHENYTWSLFLTLAEGIQDCVAPQDVELVLFQNRDEEDELARLRRVVERRLVDASFWPEPGKPMHGWTMLRAVNFPLWPWGAANQGGHTPGLTWTLRPAPAMSSSACMPRAMSALPCPRPRMTPCRAT